MQIIEIVLPAEPDAMNSVDWVINATWTDEMKSYITTPFPPVLHLD